MSNFMKARFLIIFLILNLFAVSCSDDDDEIEDPTRTKY